MGIGMFNSHNFDSDWDYYDYLFGSEEDYDPEDEQEVDGMGDDG